MVPGFWYVFGYMSDTQPRRLSLMVIEDNAELCEGLREVFELLGHDFHGYLSGHEALADRNTLSQCDVLLTDFYLPDLTGLEILQQVREIRSDLPVIFLTGSKEAVDREQVQRFPNVVVLYKPIGIDELENGLVAALKKKTGS